MRYYYLGTSERSYSRGCEEGLVLGRPHKFCLLQVQVQGYNPSARVTHAQCGMEKRSYFQKAVLGGHGRKTWGLKPLSGGFLENRILRGLLGKYLRTASLLLPVR